MSDSVNKLLEASDTEAARNFTLDRQNDISEFVQSSQDYYVTQFNKIGESARFTPPYHS